eukprot:7972566-Pyramimonas_sp.AAC.1
MVAMLVPSRFRSCVAWMGDAIDVGLTMLNVISNLEESEIAIELGGQTFAMSKEIVLAHVEKDAAMPTS